METPLQIAFHNMDSSPAIETAIRERVAKLEQFYDRITRCRVTFDAPHQHKTHGKRYQVRIDIAGPLCGFACACHVRRRVPLRVGDRYEQLRARKLRPGLGKPGIERNGLVEQFRSGELGLWTKAARQCAALQKGIVGGAVYLAKAVVGQGLREVANAIRVEVLIAIARQRGKALARLEVRGVDSPHRSVKIGPSPSETSVLNRSSATVARSDGS